ncbi:MFS transporter [uncultured Enorma sp.]|uniref:MFS transporter n=1 Tax=uncultured Enorma sp. TaxID=1714346 RepID=UPI0025F66499|nr:MFS transporter [uncultured Enorma sp.]
MREESTASTPRRPAPNPWVVLFTVVTMTFMSTLDSSIVNVALPAMQRELSVSATSIQWVSSIYLLTCCAAVLVFGRLGDMFGKMRLFQAGVALFTAGSLLCGLSTSLPALIAARVVQGVGAASATATNMGIVTEAFPSSQRGRALGIVATFVSLGLMCGPTIGGMLVAAFPWESIFLINVPIGVVSFLVGVWTLPEDASGTQRETFDIAGAITVAPAIFLVFYALTSLVESVTPFACVLLAIGVACMVAFVAVERRATYPLVSFDIFRRPGVALNVATMFFCFFAVGGTEFLLPFYLQNACGFSPDIAGLALTAIPIAMAAVGPIAGAVSDRIGSSIPCLVGLSIYAAGIFLTGVLPANATLPVIVASMAFMAAGTGMFQSPNNSLVMGAVETSQLGFAGSLVSLVRYLGMSAGVTGGTALLYGRMSAEAGYPVSAYIEGRADLFLSGYSFAFTVFAALCAVSAVATALQLVRRRM